MRLKGYMIIAVLLLILVCFYGITDIQHQQRLQLEVVKKSLARTKQELKTIQSQVYEQETWLAEVQADIWNLQLQDEALARRWR